MNNNTWSQFTNTLNSNIDMLGTSTPLNVPSPTTQPTTNSGFWGSAFGSQGQNGWFTPTVDALGGLAQSWLAFQNLGLMRDQFGFQKDFAINQYNQQADVINRQLEDRQRARLSANPTGYQSVGDYMKKNAVKSYGANGNG